MKVIRKTEIDTNAFMVGYQVPSNVEYQSGRKLGREVWKKTPHAYYCYA